MRQRETVRVIDTHTEGEPTRIMIREKLPEGCSNALEARESFRRNEDTLRTAVLQEPRGHRDQFGSVVYPSAEDDSDFTIFFLTTSGFLDMCAHATIGTSTALVYKGIIKDSGEKVPVRYNTPAGRVRVTVNMDGGEAESVSLRNVPSFYAGEYTVKAGEPLNSEVKVDLAFGGNFYAIVDSADLGLEVDASMIGDLRAAGSAISKAVHDQVAPEHPTREGISPWPLTMITGKPRLDSGNYRNIVVFPNGSFDRSPCGTGTSARGAVLFSKGILGEGDSFVHESITDTTFRCEIKGVTMEGEYRAVLPEITGSAWVTQVSDIILDPEDPLRDGFLLS